jgi:hypothetical protein
MRAMAMQTPWGADMGGWGRAVISVTLLSVLRRAAEATAGVASAGSGVIPFPTVVVLYSFYPSG